MTRGYAVERTIDASPEEVWALLTDPAGYPDWNPSVVSLDGRIAEGEKIRLVSTVSPTRPFSLTVTALASPARMVWADGMPLGLFRGVRTFLLRRDGATTRFSMREEFTGPLAPLIFRSIPDLTGSFQQFADGLKRAAEARVR
ncbi:MAG: SRPBCC domain-containing protein [Actinocatenispora sp.]